MADGILEAALLVTYEGRYRPDQEPYEPWLDFQRGKIQRALAAMSDTPPAIDLLTVGGIALPARWSIWISANSTTGGRNSPRW